jgi:hypothetical protein
MKRAPLLFLVKEEQGAFLFSWKKGAKPESDQKSSGSRLICSIVKTGPSLQT